MSNEKRKTAVEKVQDAFNNSIFAVILHMGQAQEAAKKGGRSSVKPSIRSLLGHQRSELPQSHEAVKQAHLRDQPTHRSPLE